MSRDQLSFEADQIGGADRRQEEDDFQRSGPHRVRGEQLDPAPVLVTVRIAVGDFPFTMRLDPRHTA